MAAIFWTQTIVRTMIELTPLLEFIIKCHGVTCISGTSGTGNTTPQKVCELVGSQKRHLAGHNPREVHFASMLRRLKTYPSSCFDKISFRSPVERGFELMLQNVLLHIACNYTFPPEGSPNPQILHSEALRMFI